MMSYNIYFKNKIQFCQELEKVENNVKIFLHIDCKYKNISYINFILDMLVIYNKVKLNLYLCYNEIKIFPEIVLENLELLNLSENKLETLPQSFSSLINLENLNLQNNNFKVFPEIVCELKKLTHLDLFENKLVTLPQSFSSLINLEILNLQNNNFKVFPEIVCKLQKLKNLNIGKNNISYIPISITKLTNLIILIHDIDFPKNKIPYILCDLKKYKEFYDIFYNSSLNSINEDDNNTIFSYYKNLKKKSFLYRLFYIKI